MDDIAEHKIWLKQTSHLHLKRSSRWRRWVKIGLVIIGAFVAASASVAGNIVDTSVKWPFYAFQGFGALMVFAGGVVMEFIDEGAADAIRRANELANIVDERDEQIFALADDFEYFTRLYATAAALKKLVEDVISLGAGSQDDQKRRFGAMLDVIVADKMVLFGIESDRWNFAIYIFSPKSSELHCVACRRPIRAEEEAPHRSWKPGEGHVGIAFQTQREIVASDTSEPEARSLFDAPNSNRLDDDRTRYRSIASVPIKLGGGEPIGIVVATSDVPGRFHIRHRDDAARDPVEPLRILASALAIIIKIADLSPGSARQ